MQQDPSLHDEQLEDEIELVSELVLAASQTEGRLSERAIDEVLGVDDPAAGGEERAADGDETAAAPRPRHGEASPGQDAGAPPARGDAATG
jgi:hypothetical protein